MASEVNQYDEQRNKNPREAAEYDAKLTALAQKKKNVIFSLGNMFVQKNSSETVEGTDYEPMWKELMDIEEENASWQRKRLAMQGLRKCDSCGFVLTIDSVFCNKCGQKQNPVEEEIVTKKGVCENCGTPYGEGAVFCTNCGKKLS